MICQAALERELEKSRKNASLHHLTLRSELMPVELCNLGWHWVLIAGLDGRSQKHYAFRAKTLEEVNAFIAGLSYAARLGAKGKKVKK